MLVEEYIKELENLYKDSKLGGVWSDFFAYIINIDDPLKYINIDTKIYMSYIRAVYGMLDRSEFKLVKEIIMKMYPSLNNVEKSLILFEEANKIKEYIKDLHYNNYIISNDDKKLFLHISIKSYEEGIWKNVRKIFPNINSGFLTNGIVELIFINNTKIISDKIKERSDKLKLSLEIKEYIDKNKVEFIRKNEFIIQENGFVKVPNKGFPVIDINNKSENYIINIREDDINYIYYTITNLN